MGDGLTWDAIFQQWPWFSAAAGLFVVVVGVLAVVKPKPKLHLEGTNTVTDNTGWIATGRIDFVDQQSGGDFVLQVEETRVVNSSGGVERREIRWRRATLDEAKMVLVSYHAQRISPCPRTSSLLRPPGRNVQTVKARSRTPN